MLLAIFTPVVMILMSELKEKILVFLQSRLQAEVSEVFSLVHDHAASIKLQYCYNNLRSSNNNIITQH